MNITRFASLRALIVGGLVAGTLDVGAASLINTLNPVIILRFIATGVLGRAALTGGAGAACLGLVLQWAMSVLIAAIYFAVTARLPALRRKWWWGGLSSGLVIYLIMNFVVVPFSAAPVSFEYVVRHVRPLKAAQDLVAMFVFGLIIAFSVRGGRAAPPIEDPPQAADLQAQQRRA